MDIDGKEIFVGDTVLIATNSRNLVRAVVKKVEHFYGDVYYMYVVTENNKTTSVQNKWCYKL